MPPNVLLVELWVLLGDRVGRGVCRDHAHEHGHRRARPGDAGKIAHDLVADLQSGEGHGPIMRVNPPAERERGELVVASTIATMMSIAEALGCRIQIRKQASVERMLACR